MGLPRCQELADYILLTGKGGISPPVALVLNFISGLSVVFGTIIIFSVDNLSNEAVGLLLAFSSGVYLHIACAECTPAIYAHAKTGKERCVAATLEQATLGKGRMGWVSVVGCGAGGGLGGVGGCLVW